MIPVIFSDPEEQRGEDMAKDNEREDILKRIKEQGGRTIMVLKQNGTEENLDINKIIISCMNAGISEDIAMRIALDVLEEAYNGMTTREIRDKIYRYLKYADPKTARNYKYTSRLMVRTSSNTLARFDREKIVKSLVRETMIKEDDAEKVSWDVEQHLVKLNLAFVTAPLIREIVNVKLLERGLEHIRASYTRLGMPVYDVTQLIHSGSKENANLQHNPETIHKLMADQIAREYTLVNVLPLNLADAHMKGEIHIHDLDYFAIRPFCFSHDIRFFLKNGFKADGTGDHTSIAGPAKNPEVAFLHAAKVLAASQTNCAGGQGFSYFNTFLAPYISGLDYKKVKQLAQMFIYEMSQMYVARGGQMVFSSIDMDMSLPYMFKDIPAVLPGGVVKENTTYADFGKEIKTLFNAFIDVYMKGDYQGKPFNFPKLEVQVHPKKIEKGIDEEELLKVSQLAAKFGTPYYIINQPYMPEFACYQCCSFLMPLNDTTGTDDLYNGTIRGGGMQVVTINLPGAAYEAGGDDNKLLEIIEKRIMAARDVMLLKHNLIGENLKNGMLPFMSQSVNDEGERYLEPDKQSYIIGLVGMNEMCKYHTGCGMDENDESWKFGLKVMKFMKTIVAQLRKETGLIFSFARTPAESTAFRFAKIDRQRYGDAAIYEGDPALEDSIYYTNSFHIPPSADVPLWKRLSIEGSFHPLTDGGAMSHIWLGEQNPDPRSIMELTKKIATKTAIQYMAYTKDLSVCQGCNTTLGGLIENCPVCGSEDIDWWSRITGYYQNVGGWNKGKIQELKDRKRYGV